MNNRYGLYTIDHAGKLVWRPLPTEHPATGPAGDAVVVGTGWGDFRWVLPAGDGGMYAISPDGQLRWYPRAPSGTDAPALQAGAVVGSGWDSHRAVFTGGDGVVYAIDAGGALRWHRHCGRRSATPRWLGPRVVGEGWQDFTAVFSAGAGVIYALEEGGRLLWYRHLAASTGEVAWDGPRVVSTGLVGIRHLFSGPDSTLFAVRDDGHLIGYRHDGQFDGSPTWRGPTDLGGGWGDHRAVFGPGPVARHESIALLAAALLLGAAVHGPASPLRAHTSPWVTALRAARPPTPGASWRGVQTTADGHTKTVPDRLAALLDATPTALRAAAGSPPRRLLAAAARILTEDGRPRPVAGLDPFALAAELERRYPKARVSRRGTAGLPGDDVADQEATAPRSVRLDISSIRCVVSTGEATGDDIYCVGWMLYPKNLPELVAQLDEAFKKGPSHVSQLEIDWQIRTWRTPLMQAQQGQDLPLPGGQLHFSTAPVHHGFGPWFARLLVMEDDDAEYDQLKDVIDEVGDYAGAVSQGASTVAAIAGPTMLGAAAGAVATAAQVVDVACDVASACVSIANLLDSDDAVGYIDVPPDGDYLGLDDASLPPIPPLDAGGPGRGIYRVTVSRRASGVERFSRAWRVIRTHAPPVVNRRSILNDPHGNADDVVVFVFDEPQELVLAPPVTWPQQHEPGGGGRHAEWKQAPTSATELSILPFLGRKYVARGVVHWGVVGTRGIEYTAQVDGLHFRPEHY